MSVESYAVCPCGSGKKFKWCCQPIYPGIQHAFELHSNKQVEAALGVLEQLAQEYPDRPEIHGRKAQILANEGKTDEADEALQKAFDLMPNYPFGYLLRAQIRFHEGELPGALLLARRAAAVYSPEAHGDLAAVYQMIFECEWRRNRPVAARAALQQVLRAQGNDESARQAFEGLFGPQSRLPLAARKEYSFRGPAGGAGGARRAAWDRALSGAPSRLADLGQAFAEIVRESPDDGPAWFNLGVVLAWLGENQTALEALNRYLDLETAEAPATEAATLAEVLRCGLGMEKEGDYQMRGLVFRFRTPDAINRMLQEWHDTGRMIVTQTPDQGENVFIALILDRSQPTALVAGQPPSDMARLGGYLTVAGDVFQFTSPLAEPFGRIHQEIQTRLQIPPGQLQEMVMGINFPDVLAEALVFPISQGTEEEARQKVDAAVQKHYEEVWLQRPRKVLGGSSPLDAAGHPRLRKNLLGVIQFIEECAATDGPVRYDFNRLRRLLGLSRDSAQPVAATAETPEPGAMGASELAALNVQGLSDAQLEQAFQAAHRLDAQELKARFAGALVERPIQTEPTDRYPQFNFLIQKALDDGQLDQALDHVNEGERIDCAHNQGHRRNDYELRRAQVHTRRGEADLAEEVFRKLIERVPANFRYRGTAVESMLRLKQGGKALKFAEEGLAAARQANDRDSEQYLLELMNAAKKAT